MTESLPIRRLHHIARMTRQPEAATAFYCHVLGFREIPRPPFNFRGAWLEGYGLQIHIIENTTKAPHPGGEIDTRDDHLAFAVTDLAEVKARLEAHGVAYRENHNAGGVHQIFFHDPDGHHIEVAVYADP